MSSRHSHRQVKIAPVALALAAAASLACVCTAQDNLVFNGGFETGNFAGWSVPPNVPPPQGAFFTVGGGGGHSGQHNAQLSSWNQQFMSQFLPNTVTGAEYELSFWLRVPTNAPSQLTVRWEGQDVLYTPFQLPNASAWFQFTVPLHASFSGSFLEFGQAFFPLEYHIDDISVVQVPSSSAAPLLLLGCINLLQQRSRR